MPTTDPTEQLLSTVKVERTQAFADRLRQGAVTAEYGAKLEDGRKARRREAFATLGIDPAKADAVVKHDDEAEEAELKAFLGHFGPKLAGRSADRSAQAGEMERYRQVLTESGHTIVPVRQSVISTSDLSAYSGLGTVEPLDGGAIDHGWVFPTDPSNIRIKDKGHYPNALCYDNSQKTYPTFETDFTFIPASTATYEMTAVFAFHGFYMLRVDDSWYNCRAARVKLWTRMKVRQYLELGSQDTTLIDIEKQNANEVDHYDRTQFFSYTAALRAGDPVLVSVKGQVEASAHGGGAYCEINFFDGTANYIQPLLLSVVKV